MGRPVDDELRQRLLERVTDDLLAGGLAGASLHRLAGAAGTSARMLVHHFGSREELMRQATQLARQRQLAAARAALPPTDRFVRQLRAAWAWFAREDTRRFFRLSSQLASAELGAGARGQRDRFAREWLDLLTDGFVAAGQPTARARVLATTVAAQLRGLYLDLDSTGDERRVRRAWTSFASLLADSLEAQTVSG